ncbi:hypothetical protein C8J56DRAFT_1039704 [Mycena floridula]|nr:hypothetical protein C8J56DRAFT_1039704 [Mycena floridula]
MISMAQTNLTNNPNPQAIMAYLQQILGPNHPALGIVAPALAPANPGVAPVGFTTPGNAPTVNLPSAAQAAGVAVVPPVPAAQLQPQVPIVAGAVFEAPAALLATLPNPPLAGRMIDMNPIFHPAPLPDALALHFHGAPDSRTYYVVARGRRCGIFASSTVAEGYTRKVSNGMLRARASFTDALEEYKAVWNAGLVNEA